MDPTRLPPRDAFAGLLAGLSSRSFERFIEDLYSAQGWIVARDDSRLLLRRDEPAPAQRSVLAITGASDVSETSVRDVDLVVSARRSSAVERFAADHGAELRGPDDLFDLVMFGVPRQSASGLFSEYFDRDLVAERHVVAPISSSDASGDTDPAPSSRGETVERPAPWTRGFRSIRQFGLRRSTIAAGVTLLVVLAVVAGAGGGLDRQGEILDLDRSTDALDQVASDQPGGATPAGGMTATPGDATGAAGTAAHSESRAPFVTQPRYVGLTPTCERPPELVTVIVVGALRSNDPVTDDGIRTAWNFSSRASVGSRYESFARNVKRPSFEPLFSHHSAEHTPVSREPGIASHRVTVTGPGGERHSYVVVLSNQTAGPRTGCWQIAGIVTE